MMQKIDFMVYTHRKCGFNPIKLVGRGEAKASLPRNRKCGFSRIEKWRGMWSRF
jgi:hypothetical protein